MSLLCNLAQDAVPLHYLKGLLHEDILKIQKQHTTSSMSALLLQKWKSWIIYSSCSMQFEHQEMGAILPSRHPCEIKEACGIEHWQYRLPFIEVVQTVKLWMQIKAIYTHTWKMVPDEDRSERDAANINDQQEALTLSGYITGAGRC